VLYKKHGILYYLALKISSKNITASLWILLFSWKYFKMFWNAYCLDEFIFLYQYALQMLTFVFHFGKHLLNCNVQISKTHMQNLKMSKKKSWKQFPKNKYGHWRASAIFEILYPYLFWTDRGAVLFKYNFGTPYFEICKNLANGSTSRTCYIFSYNGFIFGCVLELKRASTHHR